jgi:hypothetical protein
MEGGVDHRVHIGDRDEKGECICSLSWSVYTVTLYVIVTRVKEGWRAGLIFPS